MGHLTRYGYIALAYLHEKKNRIDLLKWKEFFMEEYQSMQQPGEGQKLPKWQS